jgi:hypothetical protein
MVALHCSYTQVASVTASTLMIIKVGASPEVKAVRIFFYQRFQNMKMNRGLQDHNKLSV